METEPAEAVGWGTGAFGVGGVVVTGAVVLGAAWREFPTRQDLLVPWFPEKIIPTQVFGIK